MTAETIAVGTEVLLGDTVDTNSAELGKTLARFGVLHFYRQTVGDNLERLTEALRLALSRADIVFTIGGLGPTTDDVTREGVARALGLELEHDPEIEAGIREKFASRRIPYTKSQVRQAMRPPGSQVLDNPNGTAPGLVCRAEGKTVVSMPGPRNEFVPMLEGSVSDLLGSLGLGVVHSRTVRIVGMGESVVEEKLSDLVSSSDPTVSPYAKTGEVHLRVTTSAKDATEAEEKLAPVVSEIERRLGSVVYGFDDDTLESVVLRLLREKGWTLAVAESCTGGGLGKRVTSVPGSSDVFLGGVISYSNSLKQSLLGLSSETLATFGAVSEECAREMSLGVCRATGSDWGVSVTGVAGPDGGTAEKPVGLVYIGLAQGGEAKVARYQFAGTREAVRQRSERAALALLRTALV